ncbi:Trm112 family protein [Arthrobacter sp. KK5.5]|uniref:Trm112 family protein n=1 Tax=Arthrobacter sp. KK5.5 TaxID=3373084 RepID=UPI003EE72C4D
MAHISPQLLAVLRCPETGSRLIPQGDELVSVASGPQGAPVRYAIDEGIPVLLPHPGAAPSDTPE